jgi:hypothetical protein
MISYLRCFVCESWARPLIHLMRRTNRVVKLRGRVLALLSKVILSASKYPSSSPVRTYTVHRATTPLSCPSPRNKLLVETPAGTYLNEGR